MSIWLVLALAGCGGKEGGGDTGGATEDTGNPIVPDGYEYLWDLDAESCDGDAIVYFLFDGEIDDSGGFTGAHSYYWFFKGEGWDGDCVDTFRVEGDEGSHAWADDACSGCERLFDTTWDLADEDRGCSGFDYEGFWEQEDVEADRFDVAVLFDALSPSGNPNTDNQMLVLVSYEDADGQRWVNQGYARGQYLPTVADDYEGGATVNWASEDGICVTITTEGG